MIEKVYQYMKKNKMFDDCRHMIVGLSGGADSVCLLVLLHRICIQYQMDMDIIAVHINHEIRGDEALRDQYFAQNLSKDLGIACYVLNKDVKAIAKLRGVSLETAGRQVRYESFAQVKKELVLSDVATKIAVAHHIDDLVETSLMHLIRGSGIQGFSGISPVNGDIIRPLLCVYKKEITEFLKREGIGYVIDSTNLESDYQRNQLRNQLIPMIENKYNPEFSKAIYHMATDLLEINHYIDRQVVQLEAACVRYDNTNNGLLAHLLLNEFQKIDKTLQNYLLRAVLKKIAQTPVDIYRKHIELLRQLCQKQVGKKINLSNGIIAVRGYQEITLQRFVRQENHLDKQPIWNPISMDLSAMKMGEEQCVQLGINICDINGIWHKVEKICLQLVDEKEIKNIYSNNVYTKFFDCDKISRKIDIRFKEQGDFIRIHADGRKKKIKKELIDLKVPANVRNHILLLACENEILWAVGVRRCQTAFIDENTKNILKICVVIGD